MKILIINGKPRTGKSIFCNTAFQKCGLVYCFSTIDEVKRLARYLGWDGKKDEKGRKFLSDIKDAVILNDIKRIHSMAENYKNLTKDGKKENGLMNSENNMI